MTTTFYRPGDILLVNNNRTGSRDWLAGLIRDGERARGNTDCAWTHSAVIVNTEGDIIEALARGVTLSHISKYQDVPTLVLSLGVPAADPRRGYAARFALAQQTHGYGFLDFISLAFSVLFGDRWSTHTGGRPICSEICARATESATYAGYPYVPERMMPSDLQSALTGTQLLPRLGFLARLRLLTSTTVKAVLGLL